ncbi:uncharacterized mitochondrial protein AtMg00810-like [Benincasa hispida]|uniref:uncharacterized mitochondrial protein AtMg00810-like n=1 Tax=Benincasa hispida TaxID=102211 RepID=UPI001901C6E2|nr:uncharacterized mitochondrial protein AtMg00810-like [Benincasa hispida]
MAILIVYVDDIVISGDDASEIERLKKRMAEKFEIKDLGKLKYFLGIEVARSKEGISVSQRKYMLDLLKEIDIIGCKPVDTPMEANTKLSDLSSSASVNKERGLMFRKSDRRCIKAYIDADWAGSVVDRKSTSGYCTFVWGNLVTWMSKKQGVVARSSVEAEYRAMSLGIYEEIWLEKVLIDLTKVMMGQ